MGSTIEVINMTKKFGNFVAVDDASFKIKKGEVFGFLGPNGSGKTTVIRMLMGLITPTSGTGKVLGYDVGEHSEEIRERVGYMSQKFSLYEDLTVDENLDFYAGVYGVPRSEVSKKKQDILKMADLVGRENMLTSNLSGGWKQRLALGCAIIHEPEILFLDEPTGGVDPIARRYFWELIYDLSKNGVTILVTTHYMDEAEQCNNIGFIHYGKILSLDTPNNMKDKVIKGDILKLKVDNTLRAMEVLDRLEGIKDSSVYGSGIHLLTESDYPQDDIKSYLRENDIETSFIQKTKPSLEDVFVFLVNEENEKTRQLESSIGGVS